MNARRLLVAALCGLALASGCSETGRPPATVFAAASLTAPFEALVREFERRHPGREIELHCAGTPQLVLQMREGAPVDVFASADGASMQRVVDLGLAAAPPAVLATNRLAIVTAEGNPHGIAGLADLARGELRVLLCGPEVPAGRYAREALARASVEPRTLSDEPSVKSVVSKVALGEVDAGIVYVTDVATDAGVDAVPIPDAQNVVATYPIAVLTAGSDRATGEAFVAFALSPDGQAILRSSGFGAP